MLFEVVLPLEALAADLAAERQLGALVAPLVYHQVVRLGEPALAVLADEFALGSHLSAEFSVAHVVIQLHYREHSARCFKLIFAGTVTNRDFFSRCAFLVLAYAWGSCVPVCVCECASVFVYFRVFFVLAGATTDPIRALCNSVDSHRFPDEGDPVSALRKRFPITRPSSSSRMATFSLETRT